MSSMIKRAAPPSGSVLSRRGFLQGTMLAAGGVALAGCGTPLAAGVAGTPVAPGTVTYWDLFGGGDGVRMAQMMDSFRKGNSKLGLEHVTLAWGNPYYTKVALSTLGDQPPDVAVSHLSRLSTLQEGGLLQELTPEDLAKHGMEADKFTKKALEGCQFNGKTYALPLDTHPFVLFYNTDICKKAGLLDSSGKLTSLDGPDAFVEAMTKAKKFTEWGGVCPVNADTSTNWRFFYSLYGQLGGEVLADQGTKVVIDEAKAIKVLKYLQNLSVTSKLMPSSVDYGGAIALFASGKSAFYLMGDWEISTFQTAKLPFSMTLFPNVFGGDHYAVQGDSHTLMIPARGDDPERTDRALTFIRALMDQSYVWAEGGHVPAWQPVATSEKFRKLKPQANYAAAAEAVVVDPPAWYSGSGSNFEIVTGSAIATVRSGQGQPEQAVKLMINGLQTFADTPSPV